MSLSPQRAANLAENPHAGKGAVVLDIGEGRGAIVAHLSAADEGAEVEIEPLEVEGGTEVLTQEHTHEHHTHEHETHQHQHPGHSPDEDGPAHPHRPHVAVVGRPTPSGEVIYSAVFPSVPAGTYRLHEADSGQTRDVVVTEGTVTELSWGSPDAG